MEPGKPSNFTLKKRVLIGLCLLSLLQWALLAFLTKEMPDYDSVQESVQNLLNQHNDLLLDQDTFMYIIILLMRIVIGIAICFELIFGLLGLYLENLCMVTFYLIGALMNILLQSWSIIITMGNSTNGDMNLDLLFTAFHLILSLITLIVGILFVRDLRTVRQNRAAGQAVYYETNDEEQIKI